jgi:hypothetical protein
MTLGCAGFVELRLYASDSMGRLGSILQSNCMRAQDLGDPANFCALQQLKAPVPLLSHLPDGKTVRFRMRALIATDPANGCNDDLPGGQEPLVVFDGFSPAVALDGSDHVVSLQIGYCGTCASLPKPCEQGGPCVPMVPCPSPTDVPSKIPGGGRCCAPNLSCAQPGDRCPDGEPALLGVGACCAECPPT